jgi:hypothetical protein
MDRIKSTAAVIGVTLIVAACTLSSATIGPSSGPGATPSPSASTGIVILGPPSVAPSSAASPSITAGSPTPGASSQLACELVNQQDASSATGVSMPAGKEGSPKLVTLMTSHINCYYTNGAVPAANVLIEVATYEPSFPIDLIENKIITQFLSKVGTNNGVTFGASKVMIDGHPGFTTLTSGTGINKIPVHIETASYWNGTTIVSVTVGNSPPGAAMTLIQLVASKLP